MSANASVNYHIKSSEPQAFRFDVDGIIGNLVSPELIPTEIEVCDLRGNLNAVDFESDGIVFKHHKSEVSDFPDSGDWRETYDIELTATLKEQIGAKNVVIFDHTVRIDDQNAERRPDQLSGGRLILGIASGDRPDEYPALNAPFALRGEQFRESYEYIRQMADKWPRFANEFGTVTGSIDMLPKPIGNRLPLLITGASQQSTSWIAEHGDGWMTYPRSTKYQAAEINKLRARIEEAGGEDKPVMKPFYIDLSENANTPPTPIHLGMRLGTNTLQDYLRSRKEIGVNHIALNLRFNRAPIEETLERLANEILSEFNSEE